MKTICILFTLVLTINTYALGPGALTYPHVVTEMARVSTH